MAVVLFLGPEDKDQQRGRLTRAQLVVQQDGRLPADLAAKKAPRLHSERVIMTQLQVRNFKEIVSCIPEVCGDIHGTVKHVYLVALQTKTRLLKMLNERNKTTSITVPT